MKRLVFLLLFVSIILTGVWLFQKQSTAAVPAGKIIISSTTPLAEYRTSTSYFTADVVAGKNIPRHNCSLEMQDESGNTINRKGPPGTPPVFGMEVAPINQSCVAGTICQAKTVLNISEIFGELVTNGPQGEYLTKVTCKDVDTNENSRVTVVNIHGAQATLTPLVPVIDPISPLTAVAGVQTTFSANVKDNIEVTRCTLRVDDGLVPGGMTLSKHPPCDNCTASQSTTFNTAGEYIIYAECKDSDRLLFSTTGPFKKLTVTPKTTCNGREASSDKDTLSPGASWQTTGGTIGIAEGMTQRYKVNVTSTGNHQFSFCPADGGKDNFESHLCLFDSKGVKIISQSRNCNTTSAKINRDISPIGIYYIQVAAKTGDVGNYTLAYKGPPTITVTAPNGGESWAIGASNNITWTSQGVTGNVNIYISRNADAAAPTWTLLFGGNTTNDETEAWTVTGPATAQARIKIVSVADGDVNDQSDANFTISAAAAADPFVCYTYPWNNQNCPGDPGSVTKKCSSTNDTKLDCVNIDGTSQRVECFQCTQNCDQTDKACNVPTSCNSTNYTTTATAKDFGAGPKEETLQNMCRVNEDEGQYYKVAVPAGNLCNIRWSIAPDRTADYDLSANKSAVWPQEDFADCKSKRTQGFVDDCKFIGVPAGTYTAYVINKKATAGGSYTIAVRVDTCTTDPPPVRSNGAPTGTLAAGTTTATLSLTTHENATCKYATTAGTSYDDMSSTFTTTGGKSHSTNVTGLANGNSYNYYVRCKDTANNKNPDDFTISFSVAAAGAPSFTIDSVTANPNEGVAPLNNVEVTANVGGTATGNIDYKLDCTSDDRWDQQITNTSDPYTFTVKCSYATAGDYTVKVQATRQTITASQTTAVKVNTDGGGGGGGGGGGQIIKFENPLKAKNLTELVDNLLNFLFTLAIIGAPILLVIAGVMFMTAAGNPARISTARNMLMWTIIGFGVILLAKGLVALLQGVLGI